MICFPDAKQPYKMTEFVRDDMSGESMYMTMFREGQVDILRFIKVGRLGRQGIARQGSFPDRYRRPVHEETPQRFRCS